LVATIAAASETKTDTSAHARIANHRQMRPRSAFNQYGDVFFLAAAQRRNVE
jgi:adenosyl cobinamide kinase/adenosyl cobinamide phosphate guanylyltransferase